MVRVDRGVHPINTLLDCLFKSELLMDAIVAINVIDADIPSLHTSMFSAPETQWSRGGCTVIERRCTGIRSRKKFQALDWTLFPEVQEKWGRAGGTRLRNLKEQERKKRLLHEGKVYLFIRPTHGIRGQRSALPPSVRNCHFRRPRLPEKFSPTGLLG